MPTKHFYLDDAKTHAITLHWGLFWRNLTVAENGQILGQVNSQKELRAGQAFSLSDGRQLTVRLRRVLLSEDLEILLDEQPLAGSSSHPAEQFKQGLYTLLFLFGINTVIGLIAGLGNVEMLQSVGFGYATVFMGVLYLGLYGWAKTRLSATAMYVALALLVLDFVLAIALAGNGQGTPPPTAGWLMRVILCTLLYKGAQGARGLKAEQQPGTVATA